MLGISEHDSESEPQDIVLHECTTLFARSLFPAWLSTYSWHWPANDDAEQDVVCGEERDEPVDRIELSVCVCV